MGFRNFLAGGDEVVVGYGGQDEGVGYWESGGGELSEVCSFSADDGHIVDAELVHIDNPLGCGFAVHINPFNRNRFPHLCVLPR